MSPISLTLRWRELRYFLVISDVLQKHPHIPVYLSLHLSCLNREHLSTHWRRLQLEMKPKSPLYQKLYTSCNRYAIETRLAFHVDGLVPLVSFPVLSLP